MRMAASRGRPCAPPGPGRALRQTGTAFGGAGAGKAHGKPPSGRFRSAVIDLTKRGPGATVRRFLIGKLG